MTSENSGELQQLSPSTWAFVQPPGGWCLNNSGVVAGRDGMITVIDTPATIGRATTLRHAIHTAGLPAPTYVVNTHFHGDHCFGNQVFAEGATIISSSVTQQLIPQAGLGLCNIWPAVDWGEISLTLPEVSFDGTLELGEAGLRLIECPSAHSPSDVAVWSESDRVLYAGDILWNGVTPFVLFGSVLGSLRAIDMLESLQPETIVPGHGAVGGLEILHRTRDYLNWCLDLAREGIAAGQAPLEVSRRMRSAGRAPALEDPERLVANVRRAYSDLDSDQFPFDPEQAFKEMIEFNGGVPACLA